MSRFLTLLVICGFFVASTFAVALYDEEVRVLKEIFAKDRDYLKAIRPPGEPTNVTVNMYVRNILALDDKHHTWKVQLTFRQEWIDTRLHFTTTLDDFKYLPHQNDKNIWVPDLFFSDEINSEHHELMTDNNLLRIFPDGHIVYSTRVTLELFCPADFTKNEIVCPIRIASYGFTKDEIDIQWKTEEPVQVSQKLYIPDFTFGGVTTSKCDSETKLGVFSCINADFKFGHGVCHA